MRAEKLSIPGLKESIIKEATNLRDKFLSEQKDIDNKIFGEKGVAKSLNSKKLSNKLLQKVWNYTFDMYNLFEKIDFEFNNISQKMEVHEKHDAPKYLWRKSPKFEPPPIDANDPKSVQDSIDYMINFFKKLDGQ